ncbi:RpiB/LacA/LacB family sugar-phosphate isomerase [Streptomyces sp. WM4235]|uniref:RpiB/LacA/LacB family sugar-phosphate isomerase n=1 Tax=Streptomyces sp. WM4235 TaxID=1415551 RepID=UPI0006AFDECE|nr:RpiB/LacA/LacB family sugar-phosphate isomerase [Streptomyces sp. WM4235]
MNAHARPLRIAVGSDKAGREYGDALAAHLRARPQIASVLDVVTGHTESAYPSIAAAAAHLVVEGAADRALLICHTGLGMAIVANKVCGIRAVTAHDTLSVRAAVMSNNAQVLTLGAGVIGRELAEHLVDAWLACGFDPHSSAARKIRMIRDLEQHGPLHPPAG